MEVTTACGYLRVSTHEQAQSGLGLAAQRAAIEKHAKAQGLEVQWFSDEGVSGAASIEHRPGLMAAMLAVPKDGVLIVAKRDRLARDPMVSAFVEIELARRRARVVSCAGEGTEDQGPCGKLIRGIIDLVAEFERAQIGARTKAAKDAARARGECLTGEPPYGFKKEQDGVRANGKPIWKLKATAESKVVETAKALRAEGLSWPKVGEALTERGFKPRRAKKWHDTQVKRMCKTESKP